MHTNNEKGRVFVIIIGAYLAFKAVLNTVIGGGLNMGDFVFAVVAFLAMFSGLQYLNYAVSAFLALGILTHIVYNVTHLPGSAVYLIEAAVDVGAIVLLVVQNDIKEHFTNKWSELDTLFKK